MNTDDLELGLDASITRRDFLNSAVLGTGAALLAQSAPATVLSEAAAFDGYSGVGDYAHANGNTWDVLSDAHSLRDGAFRDLKEVTDTGELYDVVVIRGRFAGIGAAHRAQQLQGGRKTCLVLENHRMWGGEARRACSRIIRRISTMR